MPDDQGLTSRVRDVGDDEELVARSTEGPAPFEV